MQTRAIPKIDWPVIEQLCLYPNPYIGPMKTIVMHTDNEEIVEAFKKLAQAFKVDFLEKETPSSGSNPSPSNDAYYEDPKNLAEVDAGINDMQEGRVVKMTREERRKLLSHDL